MKPDQSLIDLDFLNNISKGNNEIILKYVKIFIEDTPPQITSLENAIILKDWKAVATVAHTLKSQLNFFGARSASLLASKIKESVELEINYDSIYEQFKALKIQFQSVYDELVSFIN